MKKENMGFILLKKITFLLLLFSAAIFATSFAGRPSKLVHGPELKEVATHHEELGKWEQELNNEESVIHETTMVHAASVIM
ncbi:hypothetical protein CDL12_13339 [Handroanthus impetiginosus]|uniref:Uncharacterized protein n=1 Tax=Handroanthus impetiginosus TaxID=429701 RepID=A0A2G9H944_9LAMI|nr:hypothetical protein CDL12_13339 [Handroanthus impetiginosus]